MWALLSRRLRLWAFFVLAAPVLSRLFGKVGDMLEVRNGPSTTSRTLKKSRDWLQRRSRGPWAQRRDRGHR